MTTTDFLDQAISQRLRRLWDQALWLLEAAASSGELSLAIEGSLHLDANSEAVQAYIRELKTKGTATLESLPLVELADDEAMEGAAGAYVEALNRILINRSWLGSASDAEVTRVLLEEYGHSLDALFSETDSQGDEGEQFAALLLGEAPADSTAFENDSIAVTIDGVTYSAEAAVTVSGTTISSDIAADTLTGTDAGETFIVNSSTSTTASRDTVITKGGVDIIKVNGAPIPNVDNDTTNSGELGIEIIEIETLYGGIGAGTPNTGPNLNDAPKAERLYIKAGVTTGYSLIGNTLNNVLVGANGADTFNGGAGNDTMIGRQGASADTALQGKDIFNDGDGSNTYLDFISTTELTDATAPTAFNSSGATANIFLKSNLVLQFSENIQRRLAGSIKIVRVSDSVAVATYGSTSPRVFASGKTLTIDPEDTISLSAGTSYRLEIDNAAISDLYGNVYGGGSFSFTPTTGETVAPGTPTYGPLSGRTDVGTSSNILLTFGESIQRAAGSSILLKEASTGALVEKFDVSLGSPLFTSTRWAIGTYNSSNGGSFTRSATGTEMLFDPTNPLKSGTQYRLEIASGAIADRSGNIWGGNGTSYTFTTASSGGTTYNPLSSGSGILSLSAQSTSASTTTTISSTSTREASTTTLDATATTSATTRVIPPASDFYFSNSNTKLVLPAFAGWDLVDYKGAINNIKTEDYLSGPDSPGLLVRNFDKNNTTSAAATKLIAIERGKTGREGIVVANLFRDKKAANSLAEDLSELATNSNQVSIVGDQKTALAPSLEDKTRDITQAEVNPGIGVVRNLAIQKGNGEVTYDNGNGKWTYSPARNDDTEVTFLGDIFDGQYPVGTVEITLDLISVNDSPEQTGIAPAPIVVQEDSANSTAQMLGLSSLVYNQGGSPFIETTQNLTFTITGIPSFIEVFNGSTEVGVGTTFTGTGTSAFDTFKNLTYKTVLNGNGLGPELLTWTVTDNGGIANGGVDTLEQALAITVNPVNDAPVASGSASLATIQEDNSNPSGDSIDSLFTANFSDAADQVAGGSNANTLAGIAISSYIRDEAKGEWQYTSNSGTTWTSILNSIISANEALTLQSSDLLRFLPSENFFGPAPALSVKLIDSSTTVSTGATADASGGGTSAFSSGSVTLSHTVDAVNDAPQNTLPSVAPSGDEDTDLAITGLSITDVDAGSGTMSVTLTVTRGTLTIATASGVNLSGNGTASVGLSGTLSAINEALAASNGVRYRGDLNVNGPDTLTMTTNDGGNTGSGGAKSDTDTLAITVTPVNDAPVASGSASLTGVFSFDTNPPGATVASLFAANFSDAADQVAGGSSANTLLGVVIDGNAATADQGTWQWSTDGTEWASIAADGISTDNTGLFLAAAARLRFLPNPNFSGTPGALTARLVDSSIAAPINANSGPTVFGPTGGTSAYSAGTAALGTTILGLPTPDPAKLVWAETVKTDTTVLLNPGVFSLGLGSSAGQINAMLSGSGGVPNLHTASNGSDVRIGIGNTFMDAGEALIIKLPQQQTQTIRLDFWGTNQQQGIGLTGSETAILEASGITADGTLITKLISLNNASLITAIPGTTKKNSFVLSLSQFDSASPNSSPSTPIVAFTQAKVTAGASSQFELDFGLQVQSDVFYGTTAADTIQTGVSPAIVYALAGDDNITAGNARDLIWAGRGNNRIDGGLGSDFFAFQKGDSITSPGTTPSTNTIVTADTGLSGDLLLFKGATGVAFTQPLSGTLWQATVTWGVNGTELFQFDLPTNVALVAGPSNSSLAFL